MAHSWGHVNTLSMYGDRQPSGMPVQSLRSQALPGMSARQAPQSWHAAARAQLPLSPSCRTCHGRSLHASGRRCWMLWPLDAALSHRGRPRQCLPLCRHQNTWLALRRRQRCGASMCKLEMRAVSTNGQRQLLVASALCCVAGFGLVPPAYPGLLDVPIRCKGRCLAQLALRPTPIARVCCLQ